MEHRSANRAWYAVKMAKVCLPLHSSPHAICHVVATLEPSVIWLPFRATWMQKVAVDRLDGFTECFSSAHSRRMTAPSWPSNASAGWGYWSIR